MLRLFAVALTLSLLTSTHIRYDSIILVYAFLIGVHLLRLKTLRAESLTLTAGCVLVAFIAIAKINILLVSITLATHLRWFIPIYSYGITAAYLAAFRISWLYRRGARSSCSGCRAERSREYRQTSRRQSPGDATVDTYPSACTRFRPKVLNER